MSNPIQMLRQIASAHQYRALSGMFLIAVALVATMAIISNTHHRIHPDEFDHIAAARYYLEHWLPPVVADPRTLDSYSNYGMSYLNEWDIVYFFAGKFALLVRPVVQNEILAFRLFNVSLFLFLMCMAWARRDQILPLSILLLSPQIWYVFSYFNGDAFPLFLSLLAACELTSLRSAFNDRTRAVAARYLLLSVYVGLIVLSKRTFWMFAVFTCCYAALCEFWHSRDQGASLGPKLLRQAGLFVLMVCAVALPRIGYDFYSNGAALQKTQKIVATAELLADSDYKPSRVASSDYSGDSNLRARGVGLMEVIHWDNWRFRWFRTTLFSTFGVYHYMSLSGPVWLYLMSVGAATLLVLTLSIAIILKGDLREKGVLALSATCCVLVVSLSLYHSWVSAFQPQGRYLFAVFPILAVVLASSRKLVPSILTTILVGFSFLLSSYSFVFVGLNHIPKSWEKVEKPTHPSLMLEREWKRKGQPMLEGR